MAGTVDAHLHWDRPFYGHEHRGRGAGRVGVAYSSSCGLTRAWLGGRHSVLILFLSGASSSMFQPLFVWPLFAVVGLLEVGANGDDSLVAQHLQL